MTGPCTRCGTTLPTDLPREGTVQRFTLHKTTTTATQTHVLRLRRWRFVWMPEHSGDRLASSTFTDLDLCGSCVGAVWVFATAALFPERPSDLAAEVERLTKHSVTANRLSWRIAEAVGDVPEGATAIVGDPDEQLTRLIAERDALAVLLEGYEDLLAILGEAPPSETVHASPPKGSGVMPCCGRAPLEVPSNRVTVFPRLVTCGGREADRG